MLPSSSSSSDEEQFELLPSDAEDRNRRSAEGEDDDDDEGRECELTAREYLEAYNLPIVLIDSMIRDTKSRMTKYVNKIGKRKEVSEKVEITKNVKIEKRIEVPEKVSKTPYMSVILFCTAVAIEISIGYMFVLLFQCERYSIPYWKEWLNNDPIHNAPARLLLFLCFYQLDIFLELKFNDIRKREISSYSCFSIGFLFIGHFIAALYWNPFPYNVGILLIGIIMSGIAMVWKKPAVSIWNNLFGIHYEFKEENDPISIENQFTKTEHNGDQLKDNESGIIMCSSLCSLIIGTIAGVLSYEDVWSFLIGFPAILLVKYSTTMAVRYEKMMDLDRKINLWLSNKAAQLERWAET